MKTKEIKLYLHPELLDTLLQSDEGRTSREDVEVTLLVPLATKPVHAIGDVVMAGFTDEKEAHIVMSPPFKGDDAYILLSKHKMAHCWTEDYVRYPEGVEGHDLSTEQHQYLEYLAISQQTSNGVPNTEPAYDHEALPSLTDFLPQETNRIIWDDQTGEKLT